MKILQHPESAAGLATLVMFGLFSWWGTNFLTVNSVNTMLFGLAEWGIIALGFTLLIISGEFDLSVGSVLALSGVLVIFMVNAGSRYHQIISQPSSRFSRIGLIMVLTFRFYGSLGWRLFLP